MGAVSVFSKKEFSLVFGPQAIRALSAHAHALVLALRRERIFIDHRGRWQQDASDAYWLYSFFVVGLKQALDVTCVSHIERKSGLAFDEFIGQIVLWWMPQRKQIGLLRAIAMRLETHGVFLTLHWNRGVSVSPTYRRPPLDIQVISTMVGFIAGLVLYYHFRLDQVAGFLCAGLGYVGGELYRRSRYYRYCGDEVCRTRIRGHACSFCGALTTGDTS